MSDLAPEAATPGQAAYEAHFAVMRNTFDEPPWPWERLPFFLSEAWEAAAVASWPSMGAQRDALAAENKRLRTLVRDILQSMPDTADEQEWRDRAGELGVADPDGELYRAYTEDDS